MLKQLKKTKQCPTQSQNCSINQNQHFSISKSPSSDTSQSKQHFDKHLRETGQSLGVFETNSLSIKDFMVIKPLGKGHYSQVYLAVHKATNFIGSLKVISKGQFQGQKKQDMIQQLIDQIKLQLYAQNPYIIQLYSFFSDEENIYLFIQLGTDGELFIKMANKIFSEETTSIVIREVLRGLQYLHSNGIMHHDVKPQNIVLVHGTAKICDFGCSTLFKNKKRKRLGGTPLYWAPEILKNKIYGPQVDVWALGILTYELLFGDNPFKIRRQEDLLKIVKEEFRMKVGSIQVITFINLILKSQDKRPDTKQLLNHPFITKFIQLETSSQLLLSDS